MLSSRTFCGFKTLENGVNGFKLSVSKWAKWQRESRFRYSSSSSVRLRFAPSPTGLLHLGGFRTALLNHLFAVKNDGKCILRIEDTDQTRLVPGAVEMIEDDLTWLGLKADESPSNPGNYGPYIQSQRIPLYHENVETLIESGAAYECFCSEMRLDLIRREAIKQRQKPRYDNKCRDLTREQVKAKKAGGESYTVRFKLVPEIVKFQDLVHGPVEFDLTGNSYEGDPIIMKSDGFPTYHFANVVDDHFMEISHVLRGEEWQVSTPKHLQLYRAFNWNPPEFAHLPLIFNKDGTKLSKRQGDISVRNYKEKSYYPLALVNFVTKSGGGFSDHHVDKVYSLKELSEMFKLLDMSTAACRLDFALLSQLNQVELKNHVDSSPSSVVAHLKSKLRTSSISNPDSFSTDYLEKIVKWCPSRVSTVNDLLTPDFSYLWSNPNVETMRNISCSKQVFDNFIHAFQTYTSSLPKISSQEKSTISSFIKTFSKSEGVTFKLLMRDVRLALCGIEKGPPIADIIELFGEDETIKRLKDAADAIGSVQNQKAFKNK